MSALECFEYDDLVDVVRASQAAATELTALGLLPVAIVDPPPYGRVACESREVSAGGWNVLVLGVPRGTAIGAAENANRAAREWIATPPDADCIKLVVTIDGGDLLLNVRPDAHFSFERGASSTALAWN